MRFFSQKSRIYVAKGRKEEWKQIRKALKDAGIHPYTFRYDDELPACGCGAGLDVRDFGTNGKIDRSVYQISVLREREEEALKLVHQMFPDYVPYRKMPQIFPNL